MASHVSPFTSTTPIIIAGGGVIGLTLAQALKTAGIPFRLYERDTSISRAAGWGLTIHWALPALKSLIPPELFARFDTIQVDPEQGRKDTGRFVLLNVETLELVYVIPPAERQRIRRLGLRELLTEGVDINWGNAVTGFELNEGNEGVKVTLETGDDIKGSLLLGVDGANSRIRRQLVGEEKGKLNYLPVTGCGTSVRLTPEEIKPLKAIDPLLFQGAAPSTGTFFWFSILSTPEVNGSLGTEDEYYEGQVNISWMLKDGQGAVPEGQKEKVKFMKHLAEPFHETLRKVVNSIPDDALVVEVKLADWPTQEWDDHDGRITLVGDAAHAMTMYRGEAGNHGLLDAFNLVEKLQAIHSGEISLSDGISAYEEEMRTRTHEAVLWSRQACFDAHDLANLQPDSPLVSKRVKVKPAPGIKVAAEKVEAKKAEVEGLEKGVEGLKVE